MRRVLSLLLAALLLAALLLAALLLAALPAVAEAASVAPGDPAPAPAPATAPASGQSPATSQQPAVTNVTNVTNKIVQLPPMLTPEQFAGAVFGKVLILLLGSLADALQALIGQAMGAGGPGGGNYVTSTPPASTYASPAVAALWGKVRLAADASLALIVAYSGALIALGKAQRSPYDEALALLPRVGIALALANGSLWLGQQAILLNNALCAAVGAGLPAFGQAAGQSPNLADTLARLAYLLTGLLLILQMLMRLALVDVALVLAPAGVVLYLLPGTRPWGEKWGGIFVAAVFTQFVQVLALALGQAIIGTTGGLLGFAVGIAVLVLTLKIPGYLGGYAQHHLTTAILAAGAIRGVGGLAIRGGRTLLARDAPAKGGE